MKQTLTSLYSVLVTMTVVLCWSSLWCWEHVESWTKL